MPVQRLLSVPPGGSRTQPASSMQPATQEELRKAHAEVDALVDSIYSKKPYETDEQRLSDLFAMYERMTAEEAAKAPAKRTRGTRK